MLTNLHNTQFILILNDLQRSTPFMYKPVNSLVDPFHNFLNFITYFQLILNPDDLQADPSQLKIDKELGGTF
jgi:hypothetical protein